MLPGVEKQYVSIYLSFSINYFYFTTGGTYNGFCIFIHFFKHQEETEFCLKAQSDVSIIYNIVV